MASVLEAAELVDPGDPTAFNLAVWEKVLADSSLAGLPHHIETDRCGQIVMSPPPAPEHGEEQFGVGQRLYEFLPEGHVITECQRDARMEFFRKEAPTTPTISVLCPAFPERLT